MVGPPPAEADVQALIAYLGTLTPPPNPYVMADRGLTAAANAGDALLPSPAAEKGDKPVPPALNFTMKDITGKPVELFQYRGKVVLFVNVASKCGYTPQYKGLQKLYEAYGKDGLVVIGVPANEFG